MSVNFVSFILLSQIIKIVDFRGLSISSAETLLSLLVL